MTTRRVLVETKGLGIGGTEINAVQFAAAVREHGYESILIAPADSRPAGPSLHDVAAEYGLELREYERYATVRSGARRLRGLADETGADIVHVYGQRRMRAAHLGPCRFGRLPLVVTAYEMEISPFTLRGAELIVGTKYLEEQLAHRQGGVTLISPPVDVEADRADVDEAREFRRRNRIRDDQLLAVWVGRLASEMKAGAVRDIIRAAELLQRHDVVFLIVGTGDAEAGLREQADAVNARLGRSAVRFGGSTADPRGVYSAADVGIGMGSSAARTLSFGRSLVAVGEAGWSKRFDEEGAEGVFRNSFWSDVPFPDSVRRLAGELEPLLADAALRDRLGRFGRDFAVARFGLPAMGAKLAHVYDRARASYGLRRWALDLDLEAAAAAHILTRRVLPSGDGHTEYLLSHRDTERLRSRVPLTAPALDPSQHDADAWSAELAAERDREPVVES